MMHARAPLKNLYYSKLLSSSVPSFQVSIWQSFEITEFTAGFPVITVLNKHLLKWIEFSAHVQGHLAVFIGCAGIGSVLQQQLDTLGMALLTGLMQGSAAPRCQVHSSAPY